MIRKDKNQSTPHVLTKGDIVEMVCKIQLIPNLCPKERRQYEDLMHKYIHLFFFNYKDLREVTMENTKLNCY
jgi:hypothetical protein